jgi:hypothetical protein
MSREYIVPNNNFTAGAITLVFVNPGTTATLEFLRAWVSQAGSATSAQQRVNLESQVTAFPTLASQAPVKTKLSDPSSQITGGTAGAAGTSGITASAEGAGTKTTLYPDSFNVLNGWLWVPSPPETFTFNAGGASGFGLFLPAAPSSTANYSAGMLFREW